MSAFYRCYRVGVLALSLTLLLFPSATAAAPASTDQLLRSIGLARPALSSAPDFNLLDPDGTPVALSGYRGRWVLLNFWATWCGPCREEMPSMERLSRQFAGQGLAVLAVNQRESAALVKQFLRTHNLSFTAPLDTTGRVAGYYRVYGIPVSYLIDAHGAAVGMKAGPMDWNSKAALEVFRKLIQPDAASSIEIPPEHPLPSRLRAKADGAAVRRRHDVFSESLAELKRGDEVARLGEIFGAGELWYMVKTGNRGVGWVRGGDLEEVAPRR